MKNKIWDFIKDSKSILIMSHESPDGDAIGSAMAFYYMLKDINKDVDIVIPEFPDTFNYLSNIDDIKIKSDRQYDLVLVVDCANKERIGQINDEFSRCNKSIIIDCKDTFFQRVCKILCCFSTDFLYF